MEDVGRYFWYKELKISTAHFLEVRYGYNLQMGYKSDSVY